eukprot:c16559_g1_i1.p1 GENE.c16559_g1_i1~~c16559_g1_i1.p1  ORF type:complete len:175 (-),score=63.62 c16559_g1_i1:45-569(-)
MAFRIGALRSSRRLCLQISESEIVNGLKTKYGFSDADLSKHSAVIASCSKHYRRPFQEFPAPEMSEKEIQNLVPYLEAFYRPNQVLARSKPFVPERSRQGFFEFAGKIWTGPTFKPFLYGWFASLVLVTWVALNIPEEAADISPYVQSTKKMQGILLKEDREHLEKLHKESKHH